MIIAIFTLLITMPLADIITPHYAIIDIFDYFIDYAIFIISLRSLSLPLLLTLLADYAIIIALSCHYCCSLRH
jgi:hypothetical protein